MNRKLFASALTLTMLLSVLTVFPVFAVPPNGGVLHIVPNPITLSGAGAGYELEVSIAIDNINLAGPGVGGVQVKLRTSDIAIVKFKAGSASLPVGHFMDPDGSAEGEGNLWKVTPAKVAADGSTTECATTFYDMALAISNGDAPIYASGVIMKVKIVVVAEPPYGGSVLALLSFVTDDCVVGDPTGTELTCDDSETCQYTNNWAPPSGLPHLEVIPKDTVLTTVGQRFNLSIVIKNLDDDWRLVGFNFKLDYNETILLITNVYNGTFLEAYAGAPNGGMLYLGPIDGPDYVIAGALILPDEYGTYHAPYPSGEGTVYIIEFEGILQGIFPITYTCALDLDDTWVDFGNYVGEAIPKESSVDGTYTMKARILGRTIDVWTQYPDPYGGQGLNATSDMFWPQKEVILTAYVTYNEWPQQNKDVTFEVIAPDGTVMTVLVARTNSSMDPDDVTGYATVSFRMNWPCANPEDLFGKWTVVASVDIACEVVKDFLYFKYDYLVNIIKVTTDKDSYKHCEDIIVYVNFSSQSQMPRHVLITMTIHDELNYPIITGTEYFELTVSGAQFCSSNYYNATLTTHCDKSVVAGTATVHVCALSDWPFFGGSALCDEYKPAPTINILAEWV
jgi:hypothetical protein